LTTKSIPFPAEVPPSPINEKPFPSRVIPLLPITIPSDKSPESVQVFDTESHVPIVLQSPPVTSSEMVFH